MTRLTRVADSNNFDGIQIHFPKNPVPDSTSI
jgi:hypothetical protein